eukprot:5145805-Prymnesium_polylepis.1
MSRSTVAHPQRATTRWSSAGTHRQRPLVVRSTTAIRRAAALCTALAGGARRCTAIRGCNAHPGIHTGVRGLAQHVHGRQARIAISLSRDRAVRSHTLHASRTAATRARCSGTRRTAAVVDEFAKRAEAGISRRPTFCVSPQRRARDQHGDSVSDRQLQHLTERLEGIACRPMRRRIAWIDTIYLKG